MCPEGWKVPRLTLCFAVLALVYFIQNDFSKNKTGLNHPILTSKSAIDTYVQESNGASWRSRKNTLRLLLQQVNDDISAQSSSLQAKAISPSHSNQFSGQSKAQILFDLKATIQRELRQLSVLSSAAQDQETPDKLEQQGRTINFRHQTESALHNIMKKEMSRKNLEKKQRDENEKIKQENSETVIRMKEQSSLNYQANKEENAHMTAEKEGSDKELRPVEDVTRMKHEARDVARAEAAERAHMSAEKEGSDKELRPVEDVTRMKHEARAEAREVAAEHLYIDSLRQASQKEFHPLHIVATVKHIARLTARTESSEKSMLTNLRVQGPPRTHAERLVSSIKRNVQDKANSKKLHAARIQSLEEILMRREVTSLTTRRKKLNLLLRHVVDEFISHHFPVSLAHYIRRRILNSVQINNMVAMAKEDDDMLSKLKSTIQNELKVLTMAQSNLTKNVSTLPKAHTQLNASSQMEIRYGDKLSSLLRNTFLEFKDLFKYRKSQEKHTLHRFRQDNLTAIVLPLIQTSAVPPPYPHEVKADVLKAKADVHSLYVKIEGKNLQQSAERHDDVNSSESENYHLQANSKQANQPASWKKICNPEFQWHKSCFESASYVVVKALNSTDGQKFYKRSDLILNHDRVDSTTTIGTKASIMSNVPALKSQTDSTKVSSSKQKKIHTNSQLVSEFNVSLPESLAEIHISRRRKSGPISNPPDKDLKRLATVKTHFKSPFLDARVTNTVLNHPHDHHDGVSMKGVIPTDDRKQKIHARPRDKNNTANKVKRASRGPSALLKPLHFVSSQRLKPEVVVSQIKNSVREKDLMKMMELNRYKALKPAGSVQWQALRLVRKIKSKVKKDKEARHKKQDAINLEIEKSEEAGSMIGPVATTKSNRYRATATARYKNTELFVHPRQKEKEKAAHIPQFRVYSPKLTAERESVDAGPKYSQDERAFSGASEPALSNNIRSSDHQFTHILTKGIKALQKPNADDKPESYDETRNPRSLHRYYSTRKVHLSLDHSTHAKSTDIIEAKIRPKRQAQMLPTKKLDLPGNKKFLEEIQEEDDQHQRQYVVEAERESLHFSKQLAHFVKDRQQKELRDKLFRAKRTVAKLETELQWQTF